MVKLEDMDKSSKELTSLENALLLLQTPTEVSAFFSDLMTVQELSEMRKRWVAAQQLQSKLPYAEIEKQTGLSSTTIARVSKWLQGGKGGYNLVLSRLVSQKNEERRKE